VAHTAAAPHHTARPGIAAVARPTHALRLVFVRLLPALRQGPAAAVCVLLWWRAVQVEAVAVAAGHAACARAAAAAAGTQVVPRTACGCVCAGSPRALGLLRAAAQNREELWQVRLQPCQQGAGLCVTARRRHRHAPGWLRVHGRVLLKRQPVRCRRRNCCAVGVLLLSLRRTATTSCGAACPLKLSGARFGCSKSHGCVRAGRQRHSGGLLRTTPSCGHRSM
jgi:hypothetical protein